MELLDLIVPKNTFLVDFLQNLPKDEQEELKNSWILVHDEIIEQLQSYGFKPENGMRNLRIFFRYKENVLEQIALDYVPFKNWQAIFAIRHLKTKSAEEEFLYGDVTKVTEPKYLIRLNPEE